MKWNNSLSVRLFEICAILFLLWLAKYYLSNPLASFEKILQPGFGGIQLPNRIKRNIAIIAGILSLGLSVFFTLALVMSLRSS